MTTPNDPFVTPSSGFEDLRNYKEHAMIVTPMQIVHGLTTRKSKTPGDTSAADVNAVVLYADGTVKELTNVRVFGKGLVAQFSRSINQMVLGRIVMTKSTNGNDVWIMEAGTEEDKNLALAYWTKKASGQFIPAPAPQAAAVPAGAAQTTDPFAA